MSDACRRRCCGHGSGAHDRRGYRDACGVDDCPCHAFLPDLRFAWAVAGVFALLVLAILLLHIGAFL